MKTGQQPAPLLLREDKRRAKLTAHVVAPELAGLRLAARRHRGFPIEAHGHLLEGEGLVRESPSVASQPLILGQHEAQRSYADEVVGEGVSEERGVLALLGVGPFASEPFELSCSAFHYASPSSLFGVFESRMGCVPQRIRRGPKAPSTSRFPSAFRRRRRAHRARADAPAGSAHVFPARGFVVAGRAPRVLPRFAHRVRPSTNALAMAFWPAREGWTPSGP